MLCCVTRRKELFYYVTSGSNVICDVHWCVTVDYQQIANGNIANQIHGFTIDYGKFILSYVMLCYVMLCYAMLCYVMLCYVLLCYVMLCYVMLCYVLFCFVLLCHVMLCYVMLCYVMMVPWEQWILFRIPSNLNVSLDILEKQNSLFPKGPVIRC